MESYDLDDEEISEEKSRALDLRIERLEKKVLGLENEIMCDLLSYGTLQLLKHGDLRYDFFEVDTVDE